jgi:nucleotide-binding universal stress UspA family protein
MYQKILLCYDGSVEGRNALKEGADIAICMKAETYLLAIVRTMTGMYVAEGVTEAYFSEEDKMAREILDQGVAWLREHGLEAHGRLAVGDPIQVIQEAANRLGVDLIVLGHRPRGRLARWWAGHAEGASLLDRVHCSILAAIAHESPGH